VIINKKISIEVLKQIREFIGEDIHMSIIYNGNMYHLDKYHLRDYPGIDIDTIDELNCLEIDGFSINYPPHHIQEARNAIIDIHKKFKDQISAFQNNEHIDMTALGCSKGEGIEIIKNHFHIKDNQIYAIGDSFNDLPMFSHVHESFTFDSSDKEVQRNANHTVKSIAEAIDYLLKKD